MVCGMCEAHVNDAIRSAFPVKKVSSSRARGETVIESETSLDHEKLRQVINNTGYVMLFASEEEMTKRSLIRSILGK
jgi:copper chaperone CopZ